MFNLTINSTNVANNLNNMYQYQFKNDAFEVLANAEMMITSFQIPYSWYNITSRYNNNSFKIHWPSSTVNSITLTNGGSGFTAARQLYLLELTRLQLQVQLLLLQLL